MRVAFEIVAILERAGFAFVDVHRHQSRRRLGAHDPPLAADRKARTAQPAQPGVFHRREHAFERTFAVHALDRRAITAGRAIGRVVEVRRNRWLDLPFGDGAQYRVGRRAVDGIAADDSGRRLLAATDARRADDTDACAARALERRAQRRGSRHPARQRFADAHRQRRRRRLVLLHDVEVVIERRDFVDFGHRETHFRGEGDDVRGRNAPVRVLDAVQKLDEEIAPARRVAQEPADLGDRLRIGLPAFRAAAVRSALAHARNVDYGLLHDAPSLFRVKLPAVIRGSRSASRRAPRDRANADARDARRARCRAPRVPR